MDIHFAYNILACSVNYFVNEDELTIDDPNATLKIYEDKRSFSGNVAKVRS